MKATLLLMLEVQNAPFHSMIVGISLRVSAHTQLHAWKKQPIVSFICLHRKFLVCLFVAVVVCPAFNESNGRLNTTDRNYTSVVEVTCNPGYSYDSCDYFNNSITTTCKADGNWSNSARCQRK